MLQIESREEVQILEQYSGLLVIQISPTTKLAEGQQVVIHEQPAEVISVKNDTCELFVEDDLPMPLLTANLGHVQTVQQPQQMVDALHAYWASYWHRDEHHEQVDTKCWNDFQFFLQHIPQFETVLLPHLDVNAWQEAINSMKSSSSPGVCGWVVDDLKLLPKAAILDLAMLFWVHIQQESMLPSWLLQVRTVPLAKVVNKFQPSFIRPISIYATLYRLWARVLTHAILVSWASTMPEALIGYVPQRNMEQALWKLQYAIELQYDDDLPPIGGLTLDIVKAFNALPRLPTEWCMIRCGVPSQVVQFWQRNLRAYTRTWTIQGSVLPPSDKRLTTTGLPEGDSWSVLGMATMSLAWGLTLEAQAPIHTTMFADNWTWKTTCPQSHKVAMQLTQQFMQATKLTVDWKKSWAWATGDNHKHAWKDLIATASGAIAELPIKNHAKDLGHHLNYGKVLARETFEKRKKDGISTLHKLQSDWFDLDDTAHIIKVAVYPKVFYGSTITALGDQHLREIRTAVANAYMKGTGHPNPYLAAVLPSAAAEDPEIFLIKMVLRHARAAVIQMQPRDQTIFFRKVAAHPKEKNKVRGPAGALACYLVTIGVHMDSQGIMHASAFAEVHLLTSSWRDIVAWLDLVWSMHLQVKLRSREDWQDLPMIDFRTTANLFSKTPSNQRKHVLVDVTGANLINKRKAKFDEEQTDLCQLCHKERDSMLHRVRDCEALAHVRHDYAESMLQLAELEDVHLRLPVKYLHPFTEWKTWVQKRFPPMVPSPQGIKFLESLKVRGIRPVLYTDGSCDFPSAPSVRTAAYAVILSLEDFPDHEGHFHVLGVAECPGIQSIPRAEVAALLDAMRVVEDAILVTDCQSAIDLCCKCLVTPHVHMLHMHPLFDMVQELWMRLRAGNFELRKTRAHRSLQDAKNKSDLMEIAGNAKADLAAKSANKKFRAQRGIALEPQEEEKEVLLLQNQWKLRHALLVEKAKFEQGCTEVHKPETMLEGMTLAQRFRLWTVPSQSQSSAFLEAEALEKVRWSLWGTAYSRLLVQWLAQLRWPSEDTTYKNKRIGISWFELTFNFIATTGMLPAVNVGPHGAAMEIVQLDWESGITETEIALTTVVRNFRNALLHINQLVSGGILPTSHRARVDTLYAMGAGTSAHGFKLRPVIPRQTYSVDYVLQYFQRVGPVTKWTQWPQQPTPEPGGYKLSLQASADDEIDFKTRHSRWKAARKG